MRGCQNGRLCEIICWSSHASRVSLRTRLSRHRVESQRDCRVGERIRVDIKQPRLCAELCSQACIQIRRSLQVLPTTQCVFLQSKPVALEKFNRLLGTLSRLGAEISIDSWVVVVQRKVRMTAGMSEARRVELNVAEELIVKHCALCFADIRQACTEHLSENAPRMHEPVAALRILPVSCRLSSAGGRSRDCSKSELRGDRSATTCRAASAVMRLLVSGRERRRGSVADSFGSISSSLRESSEANDV